MTAGHGALAVIVRVRVVAAEARQKRSVDQRARNGMGRYDEACVGT